MTIDFRQVLKEYKELVEPVLFSYFNGEIPGLADENDFSSVKKKHWQMVKDYPQRGGKYLRPTLVVLSAEGLGGRREDALLTAAAMEICEDWILVHDDFEDGSLLRRGEPALHLKYSPELAINAGDVLHVIQWQMIRDVEGNLGINKMLNIHDEFYRMLMRAALGQSFEISLNGHLTPQLTDKEYEYVVDGKTSYYTIAGPLRLGALVVMDDLDYLQREVFPLFNRFGKNLGRLFQITDDILDLTSDFDGKKEQGGDIYEGKLTLMVVDLLKKTVGQDQIDVLRVLNAPRNELTKDDVLRVIDIMKEKGCIDYAREEAQKYVAESRKLLNQMDFIKNKEARAKIEAGIEFVINRTH